MTGVNEDYEKEWKRIREPDYLDEWVKKIMIKTPHGRWEEEPCSDCAETEEYSVEFKMVNTKIVSNNGKNLQIEDIIAKHNRLLVHPDYPKPVPVSIILELAKYYIDCAKDKIDMRELYAMSGYCDDLFDIAVEGRWERLIQMAEKVERGEPE